MHTFSLALCSTLSVLSLYASGAPLPQVPVTRLRVGNSENVQVDVASGRGGFFGSTSGSIANSGVSIGSTLVGGAGIVPGSTVTVGNSANITQKVTTGNGGSGPGLFGLLGGNSGSVTNSGTAVGAAFDGGAAGSSFAGQASIGDASNQSNTIATGSGGIAADSGSIADSGSSVNAYLNAAGATTGLVDAVVGSSNGGSVNVATGNGHGFGGSGSLANVGASVGSTLTA